MKPKTKKAIIIVMAIAIIATIIYFAFFRKKGWEKIIADLDISDADKAKLTQSVKTLLLDPYYQDKEQLKTDATNAGLTTDKWLVLEAAQALGWTNGISDGFVVVKPNN